MDVKIYNIEGKEIGNTNLNDAVFCAKVHPQTITDIVKAQLKNERQGTVSTKTRGDMKGGGRKPWRQKGTGRARQGSIVSPLWVGGGCTFGPKPRLYDERPPKKKVDAALRGVLTELASNQKVKVVENLAFESGKTKEVRNFLEKFGFDKVLIVVPELTKNTVLAARNMQNVKVVTPLNVNVVDLLKYGNLAISDKAVKKLEEVLL